MVRLLAVPFFYGLGAIYSPNFDIAAWYGPFSAHRELNNLFVFRRLIPESSVRFVWLIGFLMIEPFCLPRIRPEIVISFTCHSPPKHPSSQEIQTDLTRKSAPVAKLRHSRHLLKGFLCTSLISGIGKATLCPRRGEGAPLAITHAGRGASNGT